ncbi:protein-tyrosine phosphatase-like protein, partial [Chytriomyces sp. MP71]
LRFVVFDAPSDSNVAEYGAALTGLNVTVVVRSCTSTYHADKLGIKVIDLCFEDGCKAPDAIAKEFVALCVDTFGRDAFTKGASAGPAVSSVSIPAIGVHCVAGLGRAPLLVAIALIEAGMDPADAVALIRTKRRGALNAQQLNSVLEYK